MKKLLNSIMVLTVLFVGVSLPGTTQAIGQISKPIVISDALRGQDYQEEIAIFNTEKNNILVELVASDGIEGWVKFYRLDNDQEPINESIIEGSSNLRLNTIIHISESAPNGEYKGLISAISKPVISATSTESMVYLSQKIDRPVSIIVSDNEIIKMDVSVIPNEYDLVKDEALSFRLIYDNQGNIDISPQVQIKIKNDDKTIYNVIYPYPEGINPIRPNQRYEIEPIILQTAGYIEGEYEAELDFLINNESKVSKHFTFSYGKYNTDNRYSIAGFIKDNILTSYVKNNTFIINSLIASTILMIIVAVWIIKKGAKMKKNKEY